MLENYKKAYEDLYETVYGDGHRKYKETDVSSFVAMKGKGYDNQKDVRFMLVGRATNGWGKTLPVDSAEVFSQEAVNLFLDNNRFDTEWHMQDCLNNPFCSYIDVNTKEEKKYYLSKSPFWNHAKSIWCKLNGIPNKPDWFNNIVWNNIYKIAPTSSGNPSTNLIYAQAQSCVKILTEEINILKPTHVLLVIDQSWITWTSRDKLSFDFMDAFCGYDIIISNGQGIVQKAFSNGKTKVVVTCRPEKISKADYVDAVVKAFDNL